MYYLKYTSIEEHLLGVSWTKSNVKDYDFWWQKKCSFKENIFMNNIKKLIKQYILMMNWDQVWKIFLSIQTKVEVEHIVTFETCTKCF